MPIRPCSEEGRTHENPALRKQITLCYPGLKAYVLRIVSHEVYTWVGDVGPGLTKVLEDICDDKKLGWCDNIQDCGDDNNTMAADDTLADTDNVDNVPLFLLSSWRAFILVMSRDSPVAVSPASCRSLFSATTRRLVSSLDQDPPPPRLTVCFSRLDMSDRK